MENKINVKIVLKIPKNTPEEDSLYISGSFNNFNPKEDRYKFKKNQLNSTYEVDLIFDNNSFDEYRITRGDWSKSECKLNGEGVSNRLLDYTISKNYTEFIEVENWNDLVTVPQNKNKNIKIINNFYIPQLNVYRNIRILLPKSYDENVSSLYPVVYMHDGQNLFDSSSAYGGCTWKVDEIMNMSKDEFIIVGIDNGGAERASEYSPWDCNTEDGFVDTVGKGQLYGEFIVEVLKPYIDLNFRTKKDRNSTAIIGSSFGGLISLYIGLKYQNTFSKIGAFSTFVFEQGTNSSKLLSDFIRNMKKQNPMKIYMNIGDREIVGQNWKGESPIIANKKVYESLLESGFAKDEIYFEVIKKGQHNEDAWYRKLPEVFTYLYENKTFLSYIFMFLCINNISSLI